MASETAGLIAILGLVGLVVGICVFFWSIVFISSPDPSKFLKTTLVYIFGIVTIIVSLMAAFAIIRIAVSAFFGV